MPYVRSTSTLADPCRVCMRADEQPKCIMQKRRSMLILPDEHTETRIICTSSQVALLSAHSSMHFRSATLGMSRTGGSKVWPEHGHLVQPCASQRSMYRLSYLHHTRENHEKARETCFAVLYNMIVCKMKDLPR